MCYLSFFLRFRAHVFKFRLAMVSSVMPLGKSARPLCINSNLLDRCALIVIHSGVSSPIPILGTLPVAGAANCI